jgi:glycosyltransferase involved in cell wall biosynthesis
MVIITNALAKELHKQFSLPIETPFVVIAPDGVDLSRYANLPTPAKARHILAAGSTSADRQLTPLVISPDAFVAGYTGHLYEGRGIGLILKLAKQLPKITFLLVGGEPQAVNNLQTTIQEGKLTNVLVTGFVPNAKLPFYQAACDVLMMPYQTKVSASSGGDIARFLSPMKLFEYLACKRPILSSNLPVFREILNTNNAILLPPDDIEAWANSLQILRTKPGYRQELADQAFCDVQRYTWNKRAEKIFGIPQKML